MAILLVVGAQGRVGGDFSISCLRLASGQPTVCRHAGRQAVPRHSSSAPFPFRQAWPSSPPRPRENPMDAGRSAGVADDVPSLDGSREASSPRRSPPRLRRPGDSRGRVSLLWWILRPAAPNDKSFRRVYRSSARWREETFSWNYDMPKGGKIGSGTGHRVGSTACWRDGRGMAAQRLEPQRRRQQRFPIVMIAADAIGYRLHSHSHRPGQNVTGLSTNSPALIGKRLELLMAGVPSVSTSGVCSSTPCFLPASHS